MIVQADDTNTRSFASLRNRIGTVQARNWFTILRLYGAPEAWFDKARKAKADMRR